VAAERMAVRKIREVLRLHFLGLAKRAIARSVRCSRPTVTDYLLRAQRAGLTTWEQLSALDAEELERILFPPSDQPVTREKSLPDWKLIDAELRRPGVTRELLWQEYKEQHPDGYERSQFNALYREWKGKAPLVMRQEHRAGEKMFVDYCVGLSITDRFSGRQVGTQLFVAALGASSYTFAEATHSQQLPAWLQSHVHAYEFYGGVPALTVPDNLKSGVRSPDRYEPDINPAYQDLAVHYGTCVVPARVRKPRDKAKVEAAVLVAQRWILARLRNRIFYSLGELNAAIVPLLEQLNARTMRHVGQSRRELFEAIDRPALKPLPSKPYIFAEILKGRINIDYHVEIRGHFYSAPYALVHESVESRVTANTVEILHKGRRIASHVRCFRKGGFTTHKEHMPRSHRAYADWTPSRIIEWTRTIGPSAALLVEAMLSKKAHPELAYRAALGVIRLARKCTPERVELAAGKAIALGSPSYRTVKGILACGTESTPVQQPNAPRAEALLAPESVRGSSYYQ